MLVIADTSSMDFASDAVRAATMNNNNGKGTTEQGAEFTQ